MKENKMVLIAHAMLALVTLLGLACSPTPEGSETRKPTPPQKESETRKPTPPQKGSETRKPTPTPKKFTFSEVLKRAVTTKQVPDDAVVNGDTSKLWRIIFDGLGAKARDALAFVYVSLSGDDSNEGSSWEKAKQTIGGALNGIADATDTKRYIVLIGAGTYSPSASLSLKNYVALIGGFEALNNEETRYERRGTTTISREDNKQVNKQVFKNENLDTPSKKSTAVLAGVTIAKGKGEEGGGMYNLDSSPTVSHTTFSGNTATSNGGGMYNLDSSPTVTNTIFSGNTAGSGGGMYNESSSPTVTNTTFSGNTAGNGGGMTNAASSPTVTNTTFSGNTATDRFGKGGGMTNWASSPTVSHTTFSGNTAKDSGGGMSNNDNSSPVISSSIFWGNTKGTKTPNQIDNDSKSISKVAHSIVQGDSGTSIIILLEALADNGGFVKTMALKAGSQAIDKGLYFAREGTTNYYSKDGSTWYTKPTLPKDKTFSLPKNAVRYDTDARGYGYNGHPDIGAYEYGGTEP